MKLFIDVGGTNLRIELHRSSDILYEALKSQEHDLIAVIEKKLKDYPLIDFIGISFAGQVYRGEILSAPNLHVSQTRIKHYFESRYAVRLEIDNDLNCAAIAEAASVKTDSLVALYVGTGIGSAMIDDGRLIRGSHNQAFEIGHIPYKEAPFACGCGKSNCIELFVSASGLDKWLAHYHLPKVHFKALQLCADAQSEAIVAAFKEALLHAAATLITLANPKFLVLGGGLMQDNPELLRWLQERLGSYAFANALYDVTLVASSLKNGAMEGAKLLEGDNCG